MRIRKSRLWPPGRVQPGESVDLSVGLTAPESEGTYQDCWLPSEEQDDAINIVALDLGSLRGQRAKFTLVVLADGSSRQD